MDKEEQARQYVICVFW